MRGSTVGPWPPSDELCAQRAAQRRYIDRACSALREVEGDESEGEGEGENGGSVTRGRHEKIRIVKFNRRKHHRKEIGHRQWFTEVKITAINGF